MSADLRQPVQAHRHPLLLKRSDLIECKGLFFCAGEPVGISGRIEFKKSRRLHNWEDRILFLF